MLNFKKLTYLIPYIVCTIFVVVYGILAVVRHTNYQSYGYDLGINDQTVWRYSKLQPPIATIAPFSDRTKFAEHIELVYAVIAPFYWVWSSAEMLIILQVGVVCSSAIAVYLLSRKYKLPFFVSTVVMVAYLMFYGVQFGLWTDVHSSVFAAAFFMWFIYFLDIRKVKLSLVFFLLTLTAKESSGTALFFIALIYFFYRREKILLVYMIISLCYMLFIFYVFYPYIMHIQYLYANPQGLLSNLNPFFLVNTYEKQQTIFYSFASWGFLPILSPIFLLPVFSHFYKFFVLASELSGAQGLFGQYRIMLDPVLVLSTIWTLKRFIYKVEIVLGIWLLLGVIFSQYVLHLPLSYLIKQWFWTKPTAVDTINKVISTYLPKDASVVSQNNITPHISQRDKIYTLYPEKKLFKKNTPCGISFCNWFRWDGNPDFLIVDTSVSWDARHFLVDRSQFIDGLKNLQKRDVIQEYKHIGNTILYRVKKDPETEE